MSLNQVLRYVGFAVGSALAATVLEAATPDGGGAPGSGGYAVLAVVGGAVCVATAALTWLVTSAGPALRPAGLSTDAGKVEAGR